MGKLEITGTAKRDIEYDCVTMSVEFYLYKDSTTEALGEAMRQSEEFLKTLLNIGVSMENIHLGECKISQNNYSDRNTVSARREFEISFRFDMKFINVITDIINSNGYSVDLDCKYKHTDESKIHNELLEEALADSKHKAEIIAKAMGKKIVGIDSLRHNESNYNPDYLCMEKECYCLGESHSKLSDEIKAPISTEREEVEVVWIME